ncbi:MAG: SfnB family sulfur acquisition oxidoreductase [Acetobacteraceae bacterium]
MPVPPPAAPARPAHRITSDAEAIAVATRLAADFAVGAAQRDRERRLPHAEVEAFSQSGLGAINVPAVFGGADVSFVTLAKVIAIIAAADGSLGQIPQNHIAFLDLVRQEQDAEKQRFVFSRALGGYRFGNALSEASGRTTRDMATRIEARDGGFVLNGTKFYATGALFSHYIPVGALDGEGRSLRAIVEHGAPGLTVIDDWSSFGQRTTASGTVILKDVFVPAQRVIAAHLAFDRPTTYGPASQIVQAAIDFGIAQGAVADTIAFIRTRTRPWIDSGQEHAWQDPYTIAAIGDLQIRLHAAEAMLERAGHGLDRAAAAPDADSVAAASIAVAEAKVLTTEIALLATNKLFELAGDAGDAGRVQPRPALAQRPHSYAARPGTLEVSRGWQLRAERRAATPARLDLTVDRPGAAHRITSDAEALSAARDLAATFSEGAAARDRERRLPYAEMDALSQSGILAMTVPQAFGGAEVSAVTLAQVIAILAEADGSIGQIPQNHFYILEVLRLCASPAQQRFYFDRVLGGERIGNALSEIGTKTNTDFRTTLLPDGDGYVLQGRKFYSTGTLFAHWIAAIAKDAEGRRVAALIQRDTPGLTLIDDWSGFGQRTTGSGTTVFEAVRVEASAVVPQYRAFESPSRLGAFAQLIHTAVDVGIARAALADTVDFVRTRTRPWIDSGQEHAWQDPYTIAAIGDLTVRQHAAEAMLDRAGRAVDVAIDGAADTASVASIAVAEAKVLATEVALAATNKLFELAGTRATLEEFNLDRHWRNARTHTVHDPVRWKYHAIGNYWLNGIAPPRHGAL